MVGRHKGASVHPSPMPALANAPICLGCDLRDAQQPPEISIAAVGIVAPNPVVLEHGMAWTISNGKVGIAPHVDNR